MDWGSLPRIIVIHNVLYGARQEEGAEITSPSLSAVGRRLAEPTGRCAEAFSLRR